MAISCLAASMRASSVHPIILGITRAANIPMMTTTTIISTKVKPLVRIRQLKEVEFIDWFRDRN